MSPAPGHSAQQASAKRGARCRCTPPPRAFIAIAPSKQACARVQGEGATRKEMIRMRKKSVQLPHSDALHYSSIIYTTQGTFRSKRAEGCSSRNSQQQHTNKYKKRRGTSSEPLLLPIGFTEGAPCSYYGTCIPIRECVPLSNVPPVSSVHDGWASDAE